MRQAGDERRRTMDLKDARALVPGAARGIGRAIARILAAGGARLALPWFDWPESVADLEREFGGGPHLLMRADLREEAEVAALCARVGEAWGGLEMLVNNIERGGTQSYGTVPDLVGLPGIHIECKRVEKLNVLEAMKQSIRDAAHFRDGKPALFHRRSRSPWLVTMLFTDWIQLYKEAHR